MNLIYGVKFIGLDEEVEEAEEEEDDPKDLVSRPPVCDYYGGM